MLGRGAWGTMSVFALLVAAYALSAALAPGFRTPLVEALFNENGLRALGHLAGGGIALATGVLQFSTRLRVQRPSVHRFLGRVYVGTVLVSGISALLMAPSSSGGMPAHWGFGLLATLWLTTSLMALLRVRSGDYAAHREWMLRSYGLCFAAVTLRLYLGLSALAGVPFDDAYSAIAWLCRVPNLIVVEWFFVRGPLVPVERTA